MIRAFISLCLLLLPLAACAQAQGLRMEAEVSQSRETLTGGRSPWSETLLGFDWKREGGLAWNARLRATERFSLSDTEAALGLRVPLSGGWAIGGELGVSDSHRVLPKYYGVLQADKQLGGGWGVQAGWRHSEFNTGGADLRFGTLERYYANQRLAYTFYSGRPEGGASGPSHRVQWSWFYQERSQLGISLARGREVENILPRGLLTSDVRNLTLFVRHWFTEEWAGTLELATHQQGDLYRRDGVRLGLRRGF